MPLWRWTMTLSPGTTACLVTRTNQLLVTLVGVILMTGVKRCPCFEHRDARVLIPEFYAIVSPPSRGFSDEVNMLRFGQLGTRQCKDKRDNVVGTR